MSQKSTEWGVGYLMMFMSRSGRPRSTKTKIRHINTAGTARNSPRMMIRPKAL